MGGGSVLGLKFGGGTPIKWPTPDIGGGSCCTLLVEGSSGGGGGGGGGP